MASARVAPPTPEVVQFAKNSGSANPMTATFAAPLTPGNLLVVAFRDVAWTPQYDFSHPLTQHEYANRGGWNMTVASGIILPGASATVSVPAMDASHDAIGAWELANLSGEYVGSVSVQGSYGQSIVLPGFSNPQPGDFGVLAVLLGSTSQTPNPALTSIENGVVDGTAQGSIFGHVSDSLDADRLIQWNTSNNEKVLLLCVFR